VNKYIHISLKKYASDDEEYKKFLRIMNRFTRPKEGTITLNNKVVKYNHVRKNNWMILVERPLGELKRASTRYRENQRAGKKNGKGRRKCKSCEKKIPVDVNGEFCGELCKKIYEDYQAHKSKYSGGSMPDMFRSHRIVGKPTPTTFGRNA